MQRARQIKTIRVTNGSSGAAADIETDTWDTTGFDEFIVRVGISTAAATRVSLAVQSATSTTAGDFATITGCTVGSTAINTEMRVGVTHPTRRYMRAVLTSTGANLTGPVFVDCLSPRVAPTTSNTTHISASAYVVST